MQIGHVRLGVFAPVRAWLDRRIDHRRLIPAADPSTGFMIPSFLQTTMRMRKIAKRDRGG
jgi:hypothetical protein